MLAVLAVSAHSLHCMPACLQGKAVPSSLRNMYKELKTDLGCDGELSWRQLGCNRVPQ